MATAGTVPARRVSFAHLALATPWILLVIGSFAPIRDNSFLWHVAAGRVQRDLGSVLTTDPFSFTMQGEAWRTQSWLADLLYAWIEGTLGLVGYGWMMLLAGSLTFLGVGVIAWWWSRNLLATEAITLLSVPLLAAVFVPRPVLFTFPLFALAILAWEEPKLRWTLPFLVWLWAAVHGSFFLGLLYVGLRILQRREWRALPVAVVAGLASFLTAHGLGELGIVFDFMTIRPHLAFIEEWQTPNFLTPALAPFIVGLVLLLVGAIRGRLKMDDLWVVIPFLVLALSGARSVAPAWMAFLPVVASSWPWDRDRVGSGFPVAIAALFGLVILVGPWLFTEPVEIDGEHFPVAALAYADPSLRTFHDDVSGGYLIYAEALEDGVFIDDRVELYRERIDKFMDIRTGGEVWREVFLRDGIEQAIVMVDEPIRAFLEDEGWRTVYRDEEFAVMRP